MIYLIYFVEPSGKNPALAEYESAHVTCWINQDDPLEAERIAERRIRERGWRIRELIDACPIHSGHYEEIPDGLPYYEEAKEKGEVFLFFTAPKRTDGTA